MKVLIGTEPEMQVPTGVHSTGKVETAPLSIEPDEKGARVGYIPNETEEDFPTDTELRTLRRLPHQLSWTAFTIGIVELCERLTYYGTGQILTNFIQRPLPAGSTTGASGTHGQSGALGFGQTVSSAIGLFKQFFFYTTPLLGAYLADAHWGRFRTICVCIAIGIFGHIIFVIAAIPPVIAQRQSSLGVAILGIITLGLSTGGVKTNLAPLIVEQLPHIGLTTRTLSSGEKVIYDPVLTINRAYMTWYFMTNVGALLGILTMPYVEKYAGFWVAWLVPSVLYLLCPLVMLWSRHSYNRTPPHASVFAKAFRLLMFSWKHNLRATGLRGRSMWSLVKPSSITRDERPKWMTFDDAWVDEIRRCLKAAKVFAWYPLFLLCFNQINNNLVSQAALLELHGLPNEFMTVIDPLGILILVPIFDRLVYPFLWSRKIRVSPIRRITAAFVCGSAAMTWAAVLQYHIYQKSPCGYSANTCDVPAPINIGAQAGSYLLIAMGEIFGTITILEYSYAKAPKSMRSVIQALALFTNAMAAALGQALTPLTRDPLLVWNYAIPAILSFCAAFCFWFQMRDIDGQEDELNYLPAGNVNAVTEVPRPTGTAVESSGKGE